MIRAVLLDMGGVLLDMEQSQGLPVGRADWRGREALLRTLRGRRRRATLEDLERLLFGPWREVYARRYARGREAPWGPHLSRLRRAVGSRQHDLTLLGAWFRPFGEQTRELPGARQAVAALSEMGLRLALVSNVPLPGRLYRGVLERCELTGGIRSFHFSYDSGSRKPSPVMLRAALEALEVAPSEALMVGDRRAAGVRTAWIESPYREGPDPDWTLTRLDELPPLLRRLERPPA